MSGGLTSIDIVISIVYISSIIGIGIYLFKKQKSTKDFLLGGQNMGVLAIGLSLLATLTSAIGYMSFPAAAEKYGLIMLWMGLAIPIAYPVVNWVFIPFYHKLKVYTAYEYLERRFNVSVRSLASAIFILWRLTWMSLVIYTPSMVLNIVTGGKLPIVPLVIFLGLLATINSSLGGIRAVMFADVIHSFVMFASMIVAAFVIIRVVPGGLPEIWSTLDGAGKTAMTVKLEGFSSANLWGKGKLILYTDITIMALIFHYSLQKMGNYCVDQAMVQRYLTGKSIRTSRRGFLTNCIAYLFYITIMTVVGAALFAVARHFAFPETLRNDHVFPYFIANMMPIGVTGLMIAAIYGASMSSLDSGVNSCVTAIMNDFYIRLVKKKHNLDTTHDTEAERKQKLRIARITTLVLGVFVTFFATFAGSLGDIFTVSMKIVNMFTGPLFGIFILGMYAKRASSTSVIIGGFAGFLLGVTTAFSNELNLPAFQIGYLWTPVAAFLLTMVLGYLLSFIFPSSKNIDLAAAMHSS